MGSHETGSGHDSQGNRRQGPTVPETARFQELKYFAYKSTHWLQHVTHLNITKNIPESWRYTRVDSTHAEYDFIFEPIGVEFIGQRRTFSSPHEMNRWYGLHSQIPGAVLDLGGYGVASSTLVQRLNQQSTSQPTYGFALAFEVPDFQPRNSDLIIGDMTHLATPRSDVSQAIQEQMQRRGATEKAAIIWARPVIGYSEMEQTVIRQGITQDSPEAFIQFYTNMYGNISTELLALDGVFVSQVPTKLIPASNNGSSSVMCTFREQLQNRLGSSFYVSEIGRSPQRDELWHLSPTIEQDYFNIISIRRYGVANISNDRPTTRRT